MGKLNSSGDGQKRFLKHFSHDHHLELTYVLQSDETMCFGCDSIILPGTSYLSCKSCNFHLHRDCYDFPERIRHPADDHVLILNVLSSFECKACGHYGRGFAYGCATCCQHFHCVCTSKPLSVTDLSLHDHELRLHFKPPYKGEEGFSCDLCKKEGYFWLYCCEECHFDIHLHYAKCKTAVHVAGISGTTRSMGDSVSPYLNKTRNIQNVVPGNFHARNNQVVGNPDRMTATTARGPINNTSFPPMSSPQFMPNGSSSYGYDNGGGVPNMGQGQAYGNNGFVYLPAPQGNNQPIYLRPNGGPPMSVLQPNPGFGYGTPMAMNGYNQGGMRPMNRTRDTFVGHIGSGIGEGMGQEMGRMAMAGLGMGDGSMGSDLSGGGSDFAGSYFGDWASNI